MKALDLLNELRSQIASKPDKWQEKVFDEKYELLEKFNELDRTDVIITKSSGKTLVLFMRDQEVLEYFKVEK